MLHLTQVYVLGQIWQCVAFRKIRQYKIISFLSQLDSGIWKGVLAISQSGRYILSYTRVRNDDLARSAEVHTLVVTGSSAAQRR